MHGQGPPEPSFRRRVDEGTLQQRLKAQRYLIDVQSPCSLVEDCSGGM